MSLKMLSCLSAIVAIGLGIAPIPAEAGSILAARAGSSAFPEDATCFSPWGPAITNVCTSTRSWHVEFLLGDAPSYSGGPPQQLTVVVTVQSADANNNVLCRVISADKNGNLMPSSAWVQPSQVGVPSDIVLSTSVPAFGSVGLDCYVSPNAKVYTVHFY